MDMKVIELTKDNRTDKIYQQSWGADMDDLTVLQSVVNIMRQQRDRDEGKVHTAVGRFQTIAIRIELGD